MKSEELRMKQKMNNFLDRYSWTDVQLFFLILLLFFYFFLWLRDNGLVNF